MSIKCKYMNIGGGENFRPLRQGAENPRQGAENPISAPSAPAQIFSAPSAPSTKPQLADFMQGRKIPTPLKGGVLRRPLRSASRRRTGAPRARTLRPLRRGTACAAVASRTIAREGGGA